jgi:ADP-ribosylglycohydrolase
MIGAIVGDIVGSTYEFHPADRYDFELFPEGAAFTDDTVLTLATADALVHGLEYGEAYRDWGRRFPGRGYGGRFSAWLGRKDGKPYNSLGNGSAMRVSPVGWAFRTLEKTLEEARRTALPTHDHPEGIKGAQAVAGAIFLARGGAKKEDIRSWVTGTFGYDVSRRVVDIRPGYGFDETCPGSVPEALCAFFDSTDFESAVRLAVWLRGDADTQACIAGSVAEAFYGGVPQFLAGPALALLTEDMRGLLEKSDKVEWE